MELRDHHVAWNGGSAVTGPDPWAMSPATRRRLVALGLLRALGSTVVFVALYVLLPLELVMDAPVGTLVIALLLLVGVTAWEVLAITRAAHPRVRATQSLAVIGSLYLLVFAVTYFVMASTEPDTFDAQGLTRLDTLYFTVTMFATVGFGDISPASQPARLIVMVQMLLNLLVLGAGLQVLLGAVQRGQEGQASAPDP